MKLLLLASALVPALLAAGAAAAAGPSTTWSEKVRPDEAAQFAEFARQINVLQQESAGKHEQPIQRGFHAKAHAGMKVEFRVVDGIPEGLRHGLFATPGTHPAWLRLSNGVGFKQKDSASDVRGLALKVLGVKGPRLEPEAAEQDSQDFLTTNNPVSLARDATQFMAFARASLTPATMLFKLGRDVGIKEAARIVKFLATSVTRRIHSVAAETYWSPGPITIGAYAARFQFRPAGLTTAPEASRKDPDYLRKELTERLKQGELRFDFLVQLYVDEARTPIEDASVDWSEEVSPPIKLGEVVVSKRDLDSPEAKADYAAADAMSFNPWNGLAEHRPLSHIMRARRAIYRASAAYRAKPAAAPAAR